MSAAFNYVQSTKTVSATNITFTSTNAAGNMIVVAEAGFQSSVPSAVSDTIGNTYVPITFALSGFHANVFVATNIGAGTNTLTFTGASASNNDIVVAEYTAPAAFLIDGLFASSNGLSIGTSTLKYLLGIEGTASSNLPTEVFMIPILYDPAGDHTPYTLSTGTVREHTHEADNAALMLGDADFLTPGGVLSNVMTASGATFQNVFVGLVCYIPSTGGGGSAGVLLVGFDGGLRG